MYWSDFNFCLKGLSGKEHSVWRSVRAAAEKSAPDPNAPKSAIEASNAVKRAKNKRQMDEQWAAVDIMFGEFG